MEYQDKRVIPEAFRTLGIRRTKGGAENLSLNG